MSTIAPAGSNILFDIEIMTLEHDAESLITESTDEEIIHLKEK